MIPLPRSRLALASLALALACTGRGKPPESPSAPVAPPSPATAATAARPADAAVPPEVEASPLHVVALREGPIQLSRLHATPAVVLDGEPLPLVDGVPSRGPSGGRGLPTFTGYGSRASAVAIAGTLEASGTAAFATERIYVGRLDDHDVLVASLYVQSPAEAKALRRAVAKATGTTPVVECRIPSLLRAVASP